MVFWSSILAARFSVTHSASSVPRFCQGVHIVFFLVLELLKVPEEDTGTIGAPQDRSPAIGAPISNREADVKVWNPLGSLGTPTGRGISQLPSRSPTRSVFICPPKELNQDTHSNISPQAPNRRQLDDHQQESRHNGMHGNKNKQKTTAHATTCASSTDASKQSPHVAAAAAHDAF